MIKIWKLLKDHVKLDFNFYLYLSVGLFLAGAIILNYAVDLENAVIDRHAGKSIRILMYFALYATAWFVGSVLAFSFNGKLHQFKSARYWGWSTLGLAILAVNLGFPYMTQLVRLFSTDYNLYNWIYTISNNLSNFIVTALPIFLFALANDRAEYFGVNRNQVNLRPYWEILLLLVPIIAVASFETSFRNYYPTYKPNTVAVTLGWPDFLPPLVYEVAYGLDFFNVEYMFRGFFVIGMSKLLGKEAILPMVCTYCFLHFGKPPGECVSSIFGGYVLGVVAFYTRNIWGGVIVHIGLAWLMELAAFLQKAFNNA